MNWTRRQLLTTYDMSERNGRLTDVARVVGHTAAEVDLALWIMVGRSVTTALEQLNGRDAMGAKNPLACAHNG